MNNKFLYLALAGLAVWIFGKKYSAGVLNQLTYSFILGNLDLANFKIGINVTIFNPTPVSITIDSISGTVDTSGQSVFEFLENKPKSIVPGENKLTVYALPQPGTIIRNFQNLLDQPLQVRYTITSGPLALNQTIPLL